MIRTVARIGEWLGCRVPSGLDSISVTGFSIDTRTLRPGQCFVALRGPRFDGHDFVQQALDRGASVCIVSEKRCPGFPSPVQARCLVVADPFAALQKLAHTARRTWGRPVIGITGSVGKTTTKDMTAAVLASRFRVLKSEANLNNEYGLPLSLLRLEPGQELAVLEMGMAHAGELAKLCPVAEPNVGVVTAVAPVHLEFFSSVEEIARAKRELIEGLVSPATAVLNFDDPRVRAFGEGFEGEVVGFGLAKDAAVRAEHIEDRGLEGSRFELVAGGGRAKVSLRLPGAAHIHNALAAAAVGHRFGVPLVETAAALEAFQPSSMRGERLDFPQGFTVVNDAYNSNPVALRSMAEALSRTPSAVRRVLVAGEMKELGEASGSLHTEAGRSVAGLGNIDLVAGVTGDARRLVEGARAAGMDDRHAFFFSGKEEAANWLAGAVEPGDWVLLKASRGVALETLLEALTRKYPVSVGAGQREG